MELIKINKSYYIDKKETKILNNLSYKFQRGKFYLIVGHSGCGKTTLIEIMGLLLNPNSGEIVINKKKAYPIETSDNSNLIKKIGYVFQNYNLNERLTALENVLIPLLINESIIDKKEHATKLLELVGIKDRMNNMPYQLSGGEQQRVAIARSLANNPEIILADEPTGNLDEVNERKIREIFNSIKNDKRIIIMVSHSKNVEKYADVVLSLEKGKLHEI